MNPVTKVKAGRLKGGCGQNCPPHLMRLILCMGALWAPAVAQFGPPSMQRLPREAVTRTAAVQGIIRGESRLGVGGAQVVLTNLSTGRDFEKSTTGDGVFLMPELPPGDYQLTATRPGFVPLSLLGVKLVAGDISVLELTMKEFPTAPRGLRAAGAPFEVPITSPYRELPRSAAPEDLGSEPRPLEPLPGDERIFTPVPNRWNYEFPNYHRYRGPGDIPYVQGRIVDPFNRNKLKGDYPVFGNNTFLTVTLTTDTFADGRKLPTPSNLGSSRPDSAQFFGKFGQFFIDESLSFSATLFHGDTSFKPVDWQIRFTPEVNLNYLAVKENGIVNIDVSKGTTRYDQHVGLQEAFVEVKLKDLSNQYDFVSARAGIQSFNSDFRGFIFHDQEPGLRIFGNLGSNRYQYNLAAFAMLDKDTNSGLNSFNYRHQNVFIANLYRQDFFVKGYTIQGSFHYDKDDATLQYDNNHFLVRPAAVGAFQPHAIRAYYYGLTGDGHIGRLNINHAFYQVLGHDTLNPIAGHRTDINAQMAAAELSLDKDWIRYRLSVFWSSGEKNPRGNTAHGFDAIFDDPNFNGGIFSFWNREGIRLTGSGVGLVQGDSLVPSLRSSKIQGQANFVNPGLFMYNAGTDVEITPKMRGFFNLNLIRFQYTASLEDVLFQKPIHAGVGADSGIGVKYRPPLSDNIIITTGFNAFFPFQGFRDIYTGKTLYSLFTNVRFTF